MGYFQFSDCDRDGLTEICGIGASMMRIWERSEEDSLFRLQATITDHPGIMDYGGDADDDGRAEMMSIDWHSTSVSCMTLLEAPDTMSFPRDSVYAWPLNLGAGTIMPGGFTDLDGDGVQEISFRPNFRTIYVLRNTGDNSYELACTIPYPDSLIDNYYGYVWGDFDSDGRSEVVTVGSRGRVLCYEDVAPDSFAFVWRAFVPQWNTNWIVGPADIDADGILEFYCMCASSDVDGYFFYGFEADGDNSFRQFWSDSLPGNTWSGGNLALQDFDGDGREELMVCSNGNLGVYGSMGSGAIGLIYLKRGVYGTPYTYDTDRDGFGEIFFERTIPAGHDVYEFTYGEAYRGDLNADCLLNGLDVTYMINYFKQMAGYPLPPDIYKADMNGNCAVNGVDVAYLVWFLKGGPAPIDRDCL
jgi:hypothetical protein